MPKTSSAFASISEAFIFATAYMSSGLAWSMKMSNTHVKEGTAIPNAYCDEVLESLRKK